MLGESSGHSYSSFLYHFRHAGLFCSLEEEELMGNVMISGRFGCSDQEIVVCKILNRV